MAKSEVYITFITDHLKRGIVERNKVLSKFVKKWQVSDRTFDRNWKKALSAFTDYQKRLQKEKDEISIEVEKEAFREGILDKTERMQILSQIARGEIPLTKPMVVDKMIQEVDVLPDWMDRRNAIAELNKMDGSYAATKIEGEFRELRPLFGDKDEILEK